MSLLRCPVCQQELNETENKKSFQCNNNHLFDRSKQGYVNLLLNHQKKSKNPGDTQDMVKARSAFLNHEYYRPVSQAFIALAARYARTAKPNDSAYAYVDIACGEGYYTSAVHNALCDVVRAHHSVETYGLDISTPAIKAAAKRNTEITWLVASAYQLPLPSKAIDFASCLFCRLDYEEVLRILKTEGICIVATTGPNHLIELRELIYDKLKSDPVPLSEHSDLSTELQIIAQENIKNSVIINSSEMINNLLLMTPHYWRSTLSAHQKIAKLQQLTVTIDIAFTVLKKT